ncbi:MAG: thiamine phosphate synthase [Acidobacteria bacterium]|nr:thiamine phosphate synthase [Acidobacteriota bacterium]
MLMTDRRRLVAAAGQSEAAWSDLLLDQISGALAGGVDLVQIRERDLAPRALVTFLRRLWHAVPGASTRVVINDRLDIARAAGAAGVHLPEAGLPLEDVLAGVSADKFLVGSSVHRTGDASLRRSASYLLAGTVQASESKPAGWRTIGWTGLADIAAAAGTTPVLAIGGLGAADVSRVRQAGASGLAAIGALLPEPGARDVGESVRQRAARIVFAFDSQEGVSYTREAGR